MDKRKPAYDLDAIKRAFSNADSLNISGTALRSASELGFLPSDIVATIKAIKRAHFVKSMTTYVDHRLWQDVYHVPSSVGLLYVKFQADRVSEYRLMSFKERDSG